MVLTHLRLVNFRNHRRTELAPTPRLNFLVGANAQGKSSLIEAVEVAATGRSHRALRDAELICFGEEWARVRAVTSRADRDVELAVGWRREPAGPESSPVKEIRVNGVPVRRGEMFGHLLVVVASPHDEQVVAGSPVHRRRLLDVLLAQLSPAYFYTASRYARAVAQRNRLLRDHGRRDLDAWDEQVAVLGAAITARRRTAVARLSAVASDAYAALCGGAEHLTITYQPSMPGEDEGAMVEQARGVLQRRRAEEVVRGATLVGPHRDELRLAIDGRDLRLFGSRGQQQAAMLAVRLAERRVLREDTGEEPVLLLDDTLLALDEERQARLLELIGGAQALITITTLATLHGRPADGAVFRVAGGDVEVDRAHLA